ncbi:Transposable element Tc3 transposase [Anthophora quadrimaculata]
MPRGEKLTDSEIRVILNLKEKNTSVSEISKVIGRSRCAVLNYLKNRENYGKKHPGERPKATTERQRRAILRVASNSSLTVRQIAAEAGVHTNIRNVQRIIKRVKHLKRRKMQKTPPLTNRHKAAREDFAERHLQWKKKVEKCYIFR